MEKDIRISNEMVICTLEVNRSNSSVFKSTSEGWPWVGEGLPLCEKGGWICRAGWRYVSNQPSVLEGSPIFLGCCFFPACLPASSPQAYSLCSIWNRHRLLTAWPTAPNAPGPSCLRASGPLGSESPAASPAFCLILCACSENCGFLHSFIIMPNYLWQFLVYWSHPFLFSNVDKDLLF